MSFIQLNQNQTDTKKIQDFFGPFVCSLLDRDAMVSGSSLLDAINGTTHANDIDIFCHTSSKCLKVLVGLPQEYKAYKRVSSNESYPDCTIGNERYRITRPDGLAIDIIVCTYSDPLDAIRQHDLSHLQMGFDGKELWVNRDLVMYGLRTRSFDISGIKGVRSSTRYHMDDIKQFREFDPEETFDDLMRFYSRSFVVTMIRIAKYQLRGVKICDCRGHIIPPFTRKELDYLSMINEQRASDAFDEI